MEDVPYQRETRYPCAKNISFTEEMMSALRSEAMAGKTSVAALVRECVDKEFPRLKSRNWARRGRAARRAGREPAE